MPETDSSPQVLVSPLYGGPDENGKISEGDFLAHWGVIRRPDGGCFYFEDVRTQPANRVWTRMDDGDGGLVYAAGFHHANRFGYVLTNRPWVTGNEYVPISHESNSEVAKPLSSPMNSKEPAMKTVNICLGQDTAAYANFDLLVPDDLDGEQLNELIREQSRAKVEAGALDFIPECDYSGLRIVDVEDKSTGEHFLEDEALDKVPYDLGLAAENFLKGLTSYGALVAEAVRQGVLSCAEDAPPAPGIEAATTRQEG